MKRALAFLAAALLAGCATTRPRELPADDARVAHAMAYARDLLGVTEPLPVRWFAVRGERLSKDGSMWVLKSAWGDYYAGGQAQFLDSYTRIVVYVSPDGWQALGVFEHEAVHGVGRIEGHPDKWNGVKLKGKVWRW